MVMWATTPRRALSATAAPCTRHFGSRRAFDLLAACPGWLYALSVARGYVESGTIKKVLAIGAEALSKIVDWDDRSTAVLFGDGAGAAIVEAVPEPFGFRSFVLGTDGSGGGYLSRKAVAPCLPDGSPLSDKIYMNGREVFKFAVRVMDTATLQAVTQAGLTPDEIGLFVPHQANLRIIEAACERLGLPPERVVVTVDRYGNNSTASIPLALKAGLEEGRITEGDHLLLVAFGAGPDLGGDGPDPGVATGRRARDRRAFPRSELAGRRHGPGFL
jgi:3-oxoacyl-[acyl-carrier-protein] synthase-3